MIRGSRYRTPLGVEGLVFIEGGFKFLSETRQ
jgi:hypothetical protein